MIQKYAIVDIETTGVGVPGDRIIEIAVYLHDGKQIIDEFSTLINPDRQIPLNISHMTGITNEMVQYAPRFFEVAKRIVEITSDAVFVAHNVGFDYNFICREFKMLEYHYKRKTLCTVKLSRKLVPGKTSYSLGKLCDDLKIPIKNRHRAAGDALATVQLLELLLSLENNLQYVFLENMNLHLKKKVIDNLPGEPGVYYFYDENGELIYIGKSNNIHDRVISHFNNQSTRRAIEMRGKIADITFELTGNELVALLLESSEIKKHQPLYNRAQRRKSFTAGIYSYFDRHGYINFKIGSNSKKSQPFVSYTSVTEAKEALMKIAGKYKLCQKLCGLYNHEGACFQYQIKECDGACIGEEHPILYNQRVHEAIQNFRFDTGNMLIIDKGRHDEEKTIVCIENGKYLGYGFFDTVMDSYNNINSIKENITGFEDNRDIKGIIKNYLHKNKVDKIIKF